MTTKIKFKKNNDPALGAGAATSWHVIVDGEHRGIAWRYGKRYLYRAKYYPTLKAIKAKIRS